MDTNDANRPDAHDTASQDSVEKAAAPRRAFDELPPAAQRALKEAEARRAALEEAERARAPEIGGRGGKEPVRYGDYEIKGLAIDF